MAIQPVGSYVASSSPASPATTVSRDAPGAPTEEARKAEIAEATPPTREQIDKAMGEVKKALAPVARNLQFSIDDETGRSVVKVVDASTNEVIRQFPSEELLSITRSIDKLSGLFVKQKA
jgi:flagellar protein FlaG